MLKLSFNTKKPPEEIVREAEEFFKAYGLQVTDKSNCCLEMEGGGGYVRMDIAQMDPNEVTLECREW
jgi:hypothetical protein